MSEGSARPEDARGESGDRYLVPLAFVTSLFFLWGLAYGLLDVLNKHFQETLHIGRAQSGWLQAAYFGAYFCASFPAGFLMQRRGYRQGILLGLLLYAGGCFLFVPAALAASFGAFLGALFVLACGLACLETAANPYVTVLGAPATSERRLNLSQSFNGLGSFIGPLIGGAVLFSAGSTLSGVTRIYAAIGILVLGIAVAFTFLRLPEIREPVLAGLGARVRLREHRHFVLGVMTQFFYVAAQVGMGAFFINFATEHWRGLSSQRAAYLFSIALLCFLIGRFTTTALMARHTPRRILTAYALVSLALTLFASAGIERLSVFALIAAFFFMSIMFPTIFSLGVKGLGSATKRASSFMIASIVGGALLPYVMGRLAEHSSTALSYTLPAACFAVVAWYGWRGSRPS